MWKEWQIGERRTGNEITQRGIDRERMKEWQRGERRVGNEITQRGIDRERIEEGQRGRKKWERENWEWYGQRKS